MINFPDKPVKQQETKAPPAVTRYNSEPKFTTIQQQILKIPKVRQILQKDRFLYSQDIEKRVQLLGSVKNDKFDFREKVQLGHLGQPLPDKKKKRHKTNFKIPLTRKNVASLNDLVKAHIAQNQFFKNQQLAYVKQYTANAPFDLSKLKFMDELNPVKARYKQKFPQFKEGVLTKNKLLLEHVVLNRNIKREMKLDLQKQARNNSLKMLKPMM